MPAPAETALANILNDAARAAADALLLIWPNIERDRLLSQILRVNTAALRWHNEDALWQPDRHPLLFRTGQSLIDAGLVRADTAITYWADIADQANRRLGGDHPYTLSSRYDLAGAYWSAGRLAEAIPLFETSALV